MSKLTLFLELAKPDKDGFSRKVSIDEFIDKYAGLQLGNGGSWCRDDGSLGGKYNIVRHKDGTKISHIELQGVKKSPIDKKIRKDICDKIRQQRCVILGIDKVEVDHKDGRRDDPRLWDIKRQRLDDFQPLSKAVNNAKRQHCKKCRETNNRFDARQLGYRKSQVKGNGKYRGSCIGCYWYDPFIFNHAT
jgi:hypothetical protein